MASAKKILESFAQLTGLNYSKERKVAYGVRGNFSMFAKEMSSGKKSYIIISLPAGKEGQPVREDVLRRTSLPNSVKMSVDGFRVNLLAAVEGNNDRVANALAEGLSNLMNLLRSEEYIGCDDKGNMGTVPVYALRGEYAFLSEETAQIAQAAIRREQVQYELTDENYLMGALGAILAAVVTGVVVLLIARIGWIVMLVNLVMGFAVALTYEHFGKKFTKISAVICGVISILAMYLVFRLDAGMSAFKVLELVMDGNSFSFGDCFLHAKDVYIAADAKGTYDHNFFMMMVTGVIGTAGAIYIQLSSGKTKFEMVKLQ